MKLVVISPERFEPREVTVLEGLFAAGLERYHVRKPAVSASELHAWTLALPASWRPRLVLHQHHELVAQLGLGGRHWRDDAMGNSSRVLQRSRAAGSAVWLEGRRTASRADRGAVADAAPRRVPARRHGEVTSRSCHDLSILRAALGRYDAILFGPVFPSISKPGHAPTGQWSASELAELLRGRTGGERRTAVFAVGGVTAARLGEARALGFDGAAVLGAVWQAKDPLAAFLNLQSACQDPSAAAREEMPFQDAVQQEA